MGMLTQTTTTEAPQGHVYYIGLDVHKKTISYCITILRCSTRARKRKETPIERRLRLLARWSRICSPWIGANGTWYPWNMAPAPRRRNRTGET